MVFELPISDAAVGCLRNRWPASEPTLQAWMLQRKTFSQPAITQNVWAFELTIGIPPSKRQLRLVSGFSFAADQDFLRGGDIRSVARLEPLGCLGDLGW